MSGAQAPSLAPAAVPAATLAGGGPLLRGDALVAGYDRPVVGPVSFAVAAGEVVGMAGPNGCGKSTLLRALVGAARLFGGRLERAPGLAVSIQNQQQPPLDGVPLTGRELLALTGASPSGLPPWLEHRLDERLDRLSGGQRQYLSLWASLGSDAALVILDEPTNNLDPAGVAHLAEALRTQAAAGRAFLVVSHDADFLASACQRRVAMAPRTEDGA